MRTLLFLSLFLIPNILFAQTANLSAKVNFENEPAIGAYVSFEGVSFSSKTITNEMGRFKFNKVPYGNYTLKISFIGAKTLERKISINEPSLHLKLKLEESLEELEAVSITAKSESSLKKAEAIKIESIRIPKIADEVKSLSQAIDRMTGVRVQSSGSMGDRESISLNGLTGNAVRKYKDGMPFEFLYPSLSLNNIPLTNLKRIDVYKGVVPIEVGSDAMAGAINLVSDYKNYNTLNTSYSIGSFNTHRFTLNNNYQIKKDLIFNASFSYDYSDNDYEMLAPVRKNFKTKEEQIKRFNDAYKMVFTELGLIIKDKPWTDLLKLEFNYSDIFKERQNGLLLSNIPYGEVHHEADNYVTGLLYKKGFFEKVFLENHFVLSHEKIFTQDTSSNEYNWKGEIIGQNQGSEMNNKPTLVTRNTKGIINRTNVEYTISDNDALKFNVLYAHQRLNGKDEEIENPNDDQLKNTQKILKTIGGLEYTRHLFDQKLKTQIGAKYYYFNLKGFDTNDFPIAVSKNYTGYYASIKYKFSDYVFMRGSFEKALRIASAYEFFGNGSPINPNGGLKPERSNNYNFGLNYQKKFSKQLFMGMDFNVFYRDIKDMIYLEPREVTNYENQSGVKVKGLEAELNLSFFENFDYVFSFTKLEKNYSALNTIDSGNEWLIGQPFPNTPNFFINQNFTYQKDKLLTEEDDLRVFMNYKFVDTFNYRHVGEQRNDKNWVPQQHRVDLGLAYTFIEDQMTLTANVFNVFDKQLFDFYSVPRPGRNYSLKLSYTLDRY